MLVRVPGGRQGMAGTSPMAACAHDAVRECIVQPARCSTSPSHAVRPSGLLCCGSDGVERTATQHQRYGSVNLLFQTLSEDSSLLLVLVHQRIRGFAFMLSLLRAGVQPTLDPSAETFMAVQCASVYALYKSTIDIDKVKENQKVLELAALQIKDQKMH